MRTLYKLIALSAALMFTSCDDQLDLTDPNNIGPEIALSTDKNVKSTLLGAYNALSNGAYFGGNSLRNAELLSAGGEIVFSGTFNDVADIYRKEIVTANTDVANLWIASYNTINICNNVLNAINVVRAEDRNQVRGEALFLRGLSYFELTKFFGKPYSAGNLNTNLSVPLMLAADANSPIKKARSTVQEVYSQIVADLTEAESLLADGPNDTKGSKQAAAAVLSRVYLQMANYAAARDAANRVITSGIYQLETTVAGAFNGSSTSEDIFDIAVSEVDGVNNMVTFYAAAANGGRGDVEVMTAHLNLYDPLDARRNLFYIDPGTGDTRVGKWADRFSNVKLVRLAEMYLTRAEANFRLGTAIGSSPLNDINVIRNRASLSSLASVTLANILNERRLELAHEGQRLHDIKRLQQSIVEGSETFAYDADLLVFPIPQREIDVNGSLVQNSGYTQ